ncbi:MAG: hypothetical protein P0S93_04400 [Candidatus Neptunochlamydia sp.]|nr:hypothetical protein [Candidatus Neptunochlamydia sp.]
MEQLEMICLDDLVPENHTYYKVAKIWSLNFVEKRLKKDWKKKSHKGYGLLRLFKCLSLQFMESCSDRELEASLSKKIMPLDGFVGLTLKIIFLTTQSFVSLEKREYAFIDRNFIMIM